MFIKTGSLLNKKDRSFTNSLIAVHRPEGGNEVDGVDGGGRMPLKSFLIDSYVVY